MTKGEDASPSMSFKPLARLDEARLQRTEETMCRVFGVEKLTPSMAGNWSKCPAWPKQSLGCSDRGWEDVGILVRSVLSH